MPTKLGAMMRRPSSAETIPSIANSSKANSVAPLANSSENVRIFVHLRDDRVFSGNFHSLFGNIYPRWVLNGDPGYFPDESVYLRLPSGTGAVAVIKPLQHDIDINNDIPEHHRIWLLLKSRTLLTANLRRYNYERLPETGKARCFVRVPDEHAVYVGDVDYNIGRRPSWLV